MLHVECGGRLCNNADIRGWICDRAQFVWSGTRATVCPGTAPWSGARVTGYPGTAPQIGARVHGYPGTALWIVVQYGLGHGPDADTRRAVVTFALPGGGHVVAAGKPKQYRCSSTNAATPHR